MSQPIEITVRGYHLDVFRHVNNARYLEFLEEARWAFLDAADVYARCEERGLGLAVAEIDIRYRKPAHMNDRIVVDAKIQEIGRATVKIDQTVTLKDSGARLADAAVTIALFNLNTGRPIRLDDDLRALFARADRDPFFLLPGSPFFVHRFSFPFFGAARMGRAVSTRNRAWPVWARNRLCASAPRAALRAQATSKGRPSSSRRRRWFGWRAKR